MTPERGPRFLIFSGRGCLNGSHRILPKNLPDGIEPDPAKPFIQDVLESPIGPHLLPPPWCGNDYDGLSRG